MITSSRFRSQILAKTAVGSGGVLIWLLNIRLWRTGVMHTLSWIGLWVAVFCTVGLAVGWVLLKVTDPK